MLPRWLQPIENVFRWIEKLDGKRFAALMLIGAIAIAIATAIILLSRSDGGFIHAECGELQWRRKDLPVPVWVAASDLEWEQTALAAAAIVDPDHRFFLWRGLTPDNALEGKPDPVVIIGTGNFEDHGKTTLKWDEACRIRRAIIELPGLLDPGKVRTRATAHELGHALGLDHSDWETSIMYPRATTLFPFSLSTADRRRLEQAYLR